MSDSTPNLFVIGVPKAGTSAFVAGLGQHKAIYIPKNKEPRFFDAHTFYDFEEDYPIKSLDDYLYLYQNSESRESKYRVDGSVFNMYSETSIKNILKLSPDAKFILILRDPVSAVKSMFMQRLKYTLPIMREISDKFHICWESLQKRKNGEGFPKGCRNKFLFRYDLLYSYEKYVPMLLDLIPPGNIYIEQYESFKRNPDETYKHVFNFLGLDAKYLPTNKIVNPSVIIKSGFLSRVLSTFAYKSSSIRSKFGLTGSRIQFFKKLTDGKVIDENILCDVNDDNIRSEFIKTYEYLNTIDWKDHKL